MRRHRSIVATSRAGLATVVRRALCIVVALAVALPVHARVVEAADAGSPLDVPGARVVDLRDGNGGLERITTIPASSVFRQHGGTDRACEFRATGPGTASDGQHFAAGQVVRSHRWLFVEGSLPSFGESSGTPDGGAGRLADVVRIFTVFCDSDQHAIGLLFVPARDSLLDPHQQLANLRNRLQLVRPVVFSNPVVAKWGGLIARYQAWLAIHPSAWAAQRSNAATWRGWTLSLVARPVTMDFLIDFVPDRRRPSAPFHGVVSCVARGASPSTSIVAVPAMPSLPSTSKPGVNGACRWTPPGPGTVVVQARLGVAVTFVVSGYTEQLPDYVWTSRPATFSVGELAAVNTGA